MQMKSEVLQGIIPESLNCLNTKEPWTTLVIGHDKRIIFGPCRNGTIVGVVAIVPDGEPPSCGFSQFTQKTLRLDINGMQRR